VIIMMDEGLYAAPANQIPMVITSTMLGAGADPANSDLNGWLGRHSTTWWPSPEIRREVPVGGFARGAKGSQSKRLFDRPQRAVIVRWVRDAASCASPLRPAHVGSRTVTRSSIGNGAKLAS
jgi:hypothetical protein